jgi:hypothetical protein
MAQPVLDKQAFERARDFISNQARPLERALFRLHFGGSPADDVLAALADFQNEDGGFGNALEPDIRLPGSSAIATSEAFEVLRQIDAARGEKLRKRTVQYVLDSYDAERPGWPDVPPAVVEHPHAPWWQRSATPQAGPEGVWGNPDADLIAALHDHAHIVPPSLLEEMTQLALQRLDAIEQVPPYVSRCYLRLARAAPSARRRIESRLCKDSAEIMAQIDGSSLQKFWLAEAPDGAFPKAVESDIASNLDAEIARQSEDGAWRPQWSWFGNYPEVWEIADREWSGFLTLVTLRSLRAWGRLET